MILMNEIPDRFWSLFRSVNRSTYIEALLKINEEYEYSNYFLSREVCIQLLSEYFSRKKYVIWQDETEDDWDELEPPATRVLNWLLRTGWLRKVDDYASMTVNIVIPDYAAVMIEAFSRLLGDDEDETQVYIQNVYAILFSLKNDPRSSVSLLNTALINTKKLNKSLQDMLHNMDKFFGSLLEQKNYGTLLKEHLEGYVTEIVNKKYHILKTSDNFYLYKTDIKSWIAAMREDSSWINKMCAKSAASARGQKKAPLTEYDIVEKLDQLERGFDDIEHRISNMDKEHSRYVKATVTRLNYLLNQEDIGVLRKLPAVPVHGPEQPPGGAHAQETSLRIGTGRTFQRPCGIRGARRTLHPLRTYVPHRDSRGTEHRTDQLPGDLRAGEPVRLRGGPLPRGG